MRKACLAGVLTVLLGTQLISLDPPAPLAPETSGSSLPELASASSPEATPGVSAPMYRGKRWWGLCPAYAADSVSALYREYQASPRLQRALDGFDWGRARLITLPAPKLMHVAYAHQDGGVAWSSKPLALPEGELMITDRTDPLDESSGYLVRTYCCNTTSSVTRPPVRHDEPPIEELEHWREFTRQPGPVPAFLPPGPGIGVPPGSFPPGGFALPPGYAPPAVVVLPPSVPLPPGPVYGVTTPPPTFAPPHGPRLPQGPPLDDETPSLPPGLHPDSPETPHPVPEPATGLLMLLGIAALSFGRKYYARRD